MFLTTFTTRCSRFINSSLLCSIKKSLVPFRYRVSVFHSVPFRTSYCARPGNFIKMAEIVSPDTPVSKLECSVAFENLSSNEKLYAHYLSRASFEGGLIVLLQTSPESVPIFLLTQALFSGQSMQELKNASQCTEEEWKALVTYAAAFYCNMGNYKGFGDTKFIPGLPKERLYSVLQACNSYKNDQERIDRLWQSCSDAIYSITTREKQLGMKDMGITTYYSANCTNEDAEFIQDFMTEKNLSPYNTRVFKQSDPNGSDAYELRMASAATGADPAGDDDDMACFIGSHTFRGKMVDITRGDYSDLMRRLVDNLQLAKEYANNENEKSMLDGYIKSFTVGSIDAHKDGSRYWIKDKGPIIETYIGFIETYRDPFGVRGEFEGFVAMVNKEMSKKFANLVSAAEQLLPLLPWPSGFEKDTFLRPDFTSLDVLTFAGSGIPVGINIPNYDEIRQDEGFKNVSLGNVLAAGSQDKRVSFLDIEDQELYCKLKGPAFEVQVGLHELLGHGSGKLFMEDETGQLNFDLSKVTIPETDQKVDSWYHHGDTYDSKFSLISSSYEECRAECVGLHLCLSADVLDIFGYHGDDADDIIYINWLNMVRAGLMGLEYYTPEAKNWRQAHMQARYVILQVLLEVDDFVKITEVTASDGQPDLVIKLDRQKISTVGKSANANFLQKLQVFKSTCDVEAATTLYNKFSTVSDEFLKMRKIVLARKIPRRLYVQPHTKLLEDGSVCLEEFDASPEGVVESSVTRWPRYDEQLEKVWLNDKHHWPYPPSP